MVRGGDFDVGSLRVQAASEGRWTVARGSRDKRGRGAGQEQLEQSCCFNSLCFEFRLVSGESGESGELGGGTGHHDRDSYRRQRRLTYGSGPGPGHAVCEMPVG